MKITGILKKILQFSAIAFVCAVVALLAVYNLYKADAQEKINICKENKAEIITTSKQILQNESLSKVGDYLLRLDGNKVEVRFRPDTYDDWSDDSEEPNVEEFTVSDKVIVDAFNSKWFNEGGCILVNVYSDMETDILEHSIYYGRNVILSKNKLWVLYGDMIDHSDAWYDWGNDLFCGVGEISIPYYFD